MNHNNYLPFYLGFGLGILATFYTLALADLLRYAAWKRRQAANCAAYGETEAPIPSPAEFSPRMSNEEYLQYCEQLIRKMNG